VYLLTLAVAKLAMGAAVVEATRTQKALQEVQAKLELYRP
jgi:hypothetical protein